MCPTTLRSEATGGKQTLFCEEDYRAYLHLMAEWCSRWNVEVLAVLKHDVSGGATLEIYQMGGRIPE